MENNNTNNYGLPLPPPEAHYTVYKLTDPEGKVYIGCTGNPVEKRWGNGWQYKKNSQIHKAIRTIGWKNFKKEILCEKLTKEGGSKLEKWFIAYYDSANPEKGYNRALGGLGKDARVSETTKKLTRDVILRKYRGDPDYRERVSKGVLAAYEKHPDYRERVSEGHRKAYDNNPELAGRLSTARKKYFEQYPEKKEEISRRMKEYLSKAENRAFVDCDRRPKPVVCVETGEIYASGREVERIAGFSQFIKSVMGSGQRPGGITGDLPSENREVFFENKKGMRRTNVRASR